MIRPFGTLATLAAGALVLATAACGSTAGDGTSSGSSTSSSSGTSASGTSAALSGQITVFAAASLKKTFTAIGAEFEKAHPGTTVTFNFAGSSDLVSQIQQGAPADVFASADAKNMAKATTASLTAGQPVNFASNTLEIAVPPGNPAKITSLADLAKPGIKVVVCAPAVPCGSAAATVERAAKVDVKPVSEEQSVTDVLGKVASGEADAGLVYVTDVKGAGDKVKGIEFAESSSAVNTYPIAALKRSTNGSLAQAFVQAVTGQAGQGILAAAGFAKP
ncbi:molybdate transport system substrate-binding protein [Phycicoccus badiiscoriae]|uniref:Molybdate transport system substrate-binding protein n=1 Tax=Pedococcus badiiscoriae TaxID=642776 RepID=A0A852WDS8_9MICO|nr:molybdate ABC transporter substrate-binding protein [Pedococcus badiiscoriae]NYG07188.1 molybdate transport system substrate-binding protein [Pedococcus badiiscoriae]